MNKDVARPDAIKKEREELQKIVKSVTIELEEMKPTVSLRVTELSKYYLINEDTGEVEFKVDSEELRLECAAKISESSFIKNQGIELRKSVTRRLDDYKKKWIGIEDEIFSPLGKAIECAQNAADHYVKIESERAEKEKKEIQLESDKKEEAMTLESKFETNYETHSLRELMAIKLVFTKAWDSLTLVDFDARIKTMEAYKPKANIETYNIWFSGFNILLSPEEFLAISNKVQEKFPFALYENWLIDEVEKIKSDLLSHKDEKLKQLQEIDKKSIIDKGVEKEKLIKANQDKLIKEQAEMENKIQTQASEKLESKKLVHNIATQAKVQNVKDINSGIRRAQAVRALANIDWNEVIKYYSPKSDLDFLLKNLIKAGKPTITGVEYFIEKKSSTVK